MSSIVSKKLSIDKNNIEQYCDAQNMTFNVADHAWRKWLNGSSDGYITLKNEGKAVIYPTDTAHPFKADSLISASRSAGSCKVELLVGGTSVHSESYSSGSQVQKSKSGITDSVITDSTKATEIKWHVNGANGNNQRGDLIELTLYFYQYTMSANIGTDANGVQYVSVSDSAPYYGDNVTFSAVLVKGSTWHGWYSDAACTTLVSSDQDYTVSPSTDLTLYAKATTDATLYSCAAVAGAEISSVSVSDAIVPEGETTVFTAQVNTGCSFEAWYSDNTYTTIVSTDNPYIATITADTTLYAKAHRNELHMSVGTAEHGTATVSAATVPYGSDATFTFTPEDETWELYGWYSDSGLTQLVSEANPYTFTATDDVTLYPKVGVKRYTITFGRNTNVINGGQFTINAIVVYFDQLTRDERACLRSGDYSGIDSSKILDSKTVSGNNMLTSVWEEIICPYDAYVAFYGVPNPYFETTQISVFGDGDNNRLTNWPYYWFQPTQNATITTASASAEYFCNCSVINKEGIDYAYATTPTYQGREAIFEAELLPGYAFDGWYSDEACTQLVSKDNPARVVTPKYTTEKAEQTSLALYAKATKETYTIGVGTAEHCRTSVSATTAQYGDVVTFECVPDEGYEFKGWYSDEGLTQLVSEAASYEYTVKDSMVLWPKVERIQYTITLTTLLQFNNSVHTLLSCDLNSLTSDELTALKRGNLGTISQDKIFDKQTVTSSFSQSQTISIKCPAGYAIGMSATNSNDAATVYFSLNNVALTNWSYYMAIPTGNQDYQSVKNTGTCRCSAIGLDGITSAYVPSHVAQGKEAPFEAEVKSGYVFQGWYDGDGALIDSNNPASIKTPADSSGAALPAATSLTLYAKATKVETQPTGISLKLNNAWVEAKTVYMKVDGVWVQQEDPKALFSGSSTGSVSNYIYCGEVSS